MRADDMLIPKEYEPKEIEQKWYEWWLKEGFFTLRPTKLKTFSMVIPPPNVTGSLHRDMR